MRHTLNTNQYDPYPRSYQDQRYDYYSSTTTQRYNVCQYATSIPYPCRAGEYRQESVNESVVAYASAAVSLLPRAPSRRRLTQKSSRFAPLCRQLTAVPREKEKNSIVQFAECGTYYPCSPVKDPETGIKFPHTLTNGKIVVSIEEARNYCRQYGP